MYGRNRVAPEKTDTITVLFCLFLIATTEIGVVMRTKIYALRDEDRWLRYVGKTVKPLYRRLKGHLIETQYGTINHRCNWIRAMFIKGLSPTITLIEEVEGSGCKEEVRWIKYFRDRGIKLTNGTAGGDGLINPTKNIRKRMGLSQKRRYKEHGHPSTGKHPHWSDEAKKRKSEKPLSEAQKAVVQKMIATHVNQPMSNNQKKKISNTLINHDVSIKTRQKISKANMGKCPTKKARERMSKAVTKWWSKRKERML